MRFIKFDPADWCDGVRGLSLADRGAYITILVEIYRGEAPARLSIRQWAKRMNCSKSQAARHIQTLLDAGKIYRNELGALGNERARQELMKLQTAAVLKATARSFRPWDKSSRRRGEQSSN